MTVIPPFVPGQREVIAPLPSVTGDAAQSTVPFADLLENPVAVTQLPQPKPQPGLFAFTELGMFGRHGAALLPGESASGADPETRADPQMPLAQARPHVEPAPQQPEQRASLQPDAPRPPASREIAEVRAGHQMSRPLPHEHPRHPQPQTPLPAIEPPHPGAPRISPVPGEPVYAKFEAALPITPGQPQFAAAAEAGTAAPQRAMAPRVSAAHIAAAQSEAEPPSPVKGGAGAGRALPSKPESRAATPLSVLVAGSDGALAVVAGAAGEGVEDYAGLRRRVQDTAAEFGMDVAEFQLNGASGGKSFPSIMGGHHGRRAR